MGLIGKEFNCFFMGMIRTYFIAESIGRRLSSPQNVFIPQLIPGVTSCYQIRNFYTNIPVLVSDKYNKTNNQQTGVASNCDNSIDCDSNEYWTGSNVDDVEKFKYWETELRTRENFSREAEKDDEGENVTMANDVNNIDHVKDEKCLTHTDPEGKLNMVDIGMKYDSTRVAIATGCIILGKEAFSLVQENKVKKGDVLTVAQIAGINGAKSTSTLIPLCHNIPLSKIDVKLELDEKSYSVRVTSLVKTYGKTGVEMEAITAVVVATVTIYDMCKAVTKDMVITDIKLVHKSGGKSGDYSISREAGALE